MSARHVVFVLRSVIVAAQAAALAAKARSQIAQENQQEQHTETVAKGTPIFEAVKNESPQDPEKNGVMSVLAAVKELQIMSLIPAA